MSEKKSPSVIKIVLLTICAMTVLGLGACTLLVGGGLALLGTASNKVQSEEAGSVEKSITMAQFKKLKTGMTYKQACMYLGPTGVEDGSNELAGFKTSSYTWTNDNMGTINLMFQNGKLMQKTQFNLH